MNRVELVGRLTSDIQLRYTPGGMAVAKVCVAINRQMSKEKQESERQANKPTADFPRVILMGRHAEFAAQYLKKGAIVGIEGAVRTGSYENASGDKVYTTEISCDKIEAITYGKNEKSEAKAEESGLEMDSFEASEFEIEEIPF